MKEEIVLSIFAIGISILSFIFSVYSFKKNLPKLKFICYDTPIKFPLKKETSNGLLDFDNTKFSIEMLVINSGKKEISIIDILSPIEQISEIKVYVGESQNPIYFKKIFKKEDMINENRTKKKHIPIINCQRLGIELSFRLKSETQTQKNEEIYKLFNEIYEKSFIFITSDQKKYKVKLNKVFVNYSI